MKFECGDLDRAFAVPELMNEAREHLRGCAKCRCEYRLWNEISETARTLHVEWESPDLWPRIRASIEAEPRPRPAWWQDWRAWSIAASLIVGVGMLLWVNVFSPARRQKPADPDFLTDQALQEVQQAEDAYRASIEKLDRLAGPKLQKGDSALAVAYREKLNLLDSAIRDVRSNLQQNQFNASLQTQLAALYREKQKTLEDLLTHDQTN